MSTEIIDEKAKTHIWWQYIRPRFTILYTAIAIILLLISGIGHLRLLQEVHKTFGGFTWTIDPDSQGGEIVTIATPPQLPAFTLPANSLTNNTHIIAINHIPGWQQMVQVYQHAHPGEQITYTVQMNNAPTQTITRPIATFTLDMWWQTFGMTFLAGLSWLIVGIILLAMAREWTGAVEGITMLPPAMLLLLYSHWGNIQTPAFPDAVVQLLWIPSFALLGATFIHLSLTYRPESIGQVRRPSFKRDALPYLPIVLLLLYEWISFVRIGHVPIRTNLLLSLGYGAIGGIISCSIGVSSLLRISSIPLSRFIGSIRLFTTPSTETISPYIRHQLGDLLALWIGGVGLGFCLGVLPILLTGRTLVPLPIFYTLATIYPLILLYAIRSLRMIAQLHITLEQRETALLEQQKTAHALQHTNLELQRATSLLLHADAHLRSILSQRIHDQPKQQALRIRSLLGHWQHRLRVEAEREGSGKVLAQPIIDVLARVRKISEELENDLQGLQMLIEDTYQRKSLGLKFHLEKLIQEDLPLLHPESSLHMQLDLWAIDELPLNLESTDEGERIAEAISYTITQSLLNIYNHAGANFATVRASYNKGELKIQINDDGKGFDTAHIPPEKTSLFKAQLKAHEAQGSLIINSIPRPDTNHGTTVLLHIPLPASIQQAIAET
ncbi:MAG TPA: hypothetical protein VL461_04255 [Dictyobacter sp.]|nr:hypothetical protein [Dictyobacter sp.]